MKRCRRCGATKPVEAYRPTRSMRDGLSSWCKACVVERTRQWRRENREAYNAGKRLPLIEKQCASCPRFFQTSRAATIYCERCRRTKPISSREADRVRRRRLGRTWGQGHRTPAAVAELRARDGDDCHLCGRLIDFAARFPHPLSASIDHVIPLARGGQHTHENVRLAHLGCNTRRGAWPLRAQREEVA